jgi:hypothetical protein
VSAAAIIEELALAALGIEVTVGLGVMAVTEPPYTFTKIVIATSPISLLVATAAISYDRQASMVSCLLIATGVGSLAGCSVLEGIRWIDRYAQRKDARQ